MGISILVLLLIFILPVYSYSINPNTNSAVHQYISNQSQFAWMDIHSEISNNINLFQSSKKFQKNLDRS